MAAVDLIQEPYVLRKLTLPNRLIVPPMCMGVAATGTGLANDEHFVHYGTLSENGMGMIIVEATAVQYCGVITPGDLGIYSDEHIEPLRKICDYVHSHSPTKIALQLAHAGRKGAVENYTDAHPKHLSANDEHGFQCVSASAIPHSPDMLTPKELTIEEIEQLKKDYVAAAKRAVEAGFDAIEIHAAHGYLLNQFTSPISNHRTDKYGCGSEENRFRLVLEIIEVIRQTIPQDMPLLCRLSCVDWVEGGITIKDSCRLAKQLHHKGVDLIDCSSGGVSYQQHINLTLGYQITFAEQIKENTGGIGTIAVGNIKTYDLARDIIQSGKVDLVAVGRAHLVNPYWWRCSLVERGIIPWHPQRQSWGFGKTLRRIEAERKATEEATSKAVDK